MKRNYSEAWILLCTLAFILIAAVALFQITGNDLNGISMFMILILAILGIIMSIVAANEARRDEKNGGQS